MPTESSLSQPHTTQSSSTITTAARDSASSASEIHQGSGIWNQWKWTTDPPKKALEGILPPGSKRPRKEVNYSEARAVSSPILNSPPPHTNAMKSAAFSAVVTRMHAAFSTLDSVVQLSNHGHHQWYRSRAYSASAPHSYSDIVNTNNPEDWFKAADEEITQLLKYGTWKLVPPPEGANIMKNTWVFRIKEKNGLVVRYKARLCACGYSQIAGVDYKELFSPTIHSSSFRLHLSLIAQRKMVTKQMDVTGAFLNGVPEEVLHMKQPAGYVDPDHPDWVCRLLRNLYGLKQAPRVWHQTVDPFIKSLGFAASSGDPCLYFRWDKDCLSVISLHVDDFTISSDLQTTLDRIGKDLAGKFEMTDDGELHHVLGLTIERDLTKDLLYISQKSYIHALLEKFSMASSKSVKTPMDSLTVSSADCPLPGTEEQLEMTSVPYREACGSLMSLAINSRPDILFAVGVACRYMHNPGYAHWSLLKRIMKYLVGTIDLRLCLGGANLSAGIIESTQKTLVQGQLKFHGRYDSDWAGDRDHARSTSGYYFIWANSLISWSSKLQATVSSSSTMAEYVSAYHTTAEALWLRETLLSMNLLDPSVSIPLLGDNSGAHSISKDHLITQRSKHLATKYHLVRRETQKGSITLVDIASVDNTSDIFTKPLGSALFIRHRTGLGLC